MSWLFSEILIKTIKEIGHYWKNSAFTHLVVVNMPSEDSQKVYIIL